MLVEKKKRANRKAQTVIRATLSNRNRFMRTKVTLPTFKFAEPKEPSCDTLLNSSLPMQRA